MEYSKTTFKGKMRAWNQLKEEVEAGVAAPSFGRDLVETDYKDQVVDDEACAWILGGESIHLSWLPSHQLTRPGLADAGTEITAVVMQNLILYLAATPAAQKAAYDEIARVVGGSRPPAYTDLPNLPYIRACVKEALRIAPVPPWAIKHFSDAEVTYKNHRIPAGTVVLANTSAMHYDPERFPEPEKFRPERYLDHPKLSAEYAAMRDPYARDHFTFGGGRRICPGARLAENTVDIMAANLLWAFEILPPLIEGEKGEKLGQIDTGDAAFDVGAFRAPKPFKARFVPRPEEKRDLIARLWHLAKVDGYQLRGVTVNAQGIER
jgi:hypothetical protein